MGYLISWYLPLSSFSHTAFWVLRPTIGATHASPALQVPEKKSLATNTPG